MAYFRAAGSLELQVQCHRILWRWLKAGCGWEREPEKNRQQINKELIPFHSNSYTSSRNIASAVRPYRNEANRVFQKSNNEKIKSCGAFPLSALLINS